MSRAFVARPANMGSLLSNVAPVTEGVSASPGAMDLASRSDHVHRRLTSSTAGVTNGTGEATVVFTRTFAQEPGITLMPRELVDGGAIASKVKNWTQDAQGNYTGAVVKFYRIQALPAVLTLLSGLINFRVDAGTVGALPFTCIAVERSG